MTALKTHLQAIGANPLSSRVRGPTRSFSRVIEDKVSIGLNRQSVGSHTCKIINPRNSIPPTITNLAQLCCWTNERYCCLQCRRVECCRWFVPPSDSGVWGKEGMWVWQRGWSQWRRECHHEFRLGQLEHW